MTRPLNSSRPAGSTPYTKRNAPASSPTPNGAAPQTPSAGERTDVQKTNAGEGALTPQEQQAIDRAFPETPELSMRLYGRGRDSETVNPNAVGTHLDVTG